MSAIRESVLGWLAFLASKFEKLNLKVTRLETWDQLLSRKDYLEKLNRLYALGIETDFDIRRGIEYVAVSQSQVAQDLIALAVNGYKMNGFFVEVGAANGKSLSNTFLLEKFFKWNGILSEPNPNYACEININRSAFIDNRAVFSKSGQTLSFAIASQLSTLVGFGQEDKFAKLRSKARTIDVETVSLNQLLQDYCAPEEIDFLSVDTEGSELEILQALDWDKYRFNFICCEHNHTSIELQLDQLFASKGYVRVLQTESDFDAWYISKKLLRVPKSNLNSN